MLRAETPAGWLRRFRSYLDSLSLRLGVLFVVLLLAAALMVGYLFDRGRAEAVEHRALEQLTRHATRTADTLTHQVERLRRDSIFLAGTPPMQGIRRALVSGGTDPVDASTDRQWRERLAQIFLAFSKTRPEYYQLGLIAADDGRELVRVEWSEDRLRVVPSDGLKREGPIYYFEEASRTPGGGVYVSRIDARREQDGVAPGNRPTIRAAAPVSAPDGKPFAVVVVDLDMGPTFRQAGQQLHEQEQLYIADEQGRLVPHSDPDKSLGLALDRAFPNEKSVPDYPEAIAAAAPGEGYFFEWEQDGQTQVAFATRRALDARGLQQALLVIVSKPAAAIGQHVGLMRQESLAGMGILMLGAALIAMLTVHHLTRYLRRVVHASQSIARGDYRMSLPAVKGGEVGTLTRAFRRMADEVQSREQTLGALNRDLELRVLERTQDLEESRLQISRQQSMQRLILEGIDDGVIVGDPQGRFLLWNRKAAAIVGSGPDDVAPDRWSEHYGVYYSEGGEPVATQDLPLVRAIHGESTDGFELFLRGSTEGGRWVSVNGRPLRDGEGNLEGGVVTMMDITERKRLQDRLIKHQGELAKVGRLALMGEVTAMASHELSQPVAAMANYAGAATQLHRAGRLDETRLTEILENILRLADRMGQTLENLRGLARGHRPSPADVGIAGVVESCLNLLADRIAREGVRLELDLAADLPPVHADPMDLEQILMHLVINALDALQQVPRESRCLCIRSCPDADRGRVQVEVRDTGEGVAPGLVDRLFEPWVTDKEDGVGIGLSIVRTIVEKLAGRVWTEPAQPSGAIFRLELPYRETGPRS